MKPATSTPPASLLDVTLPSKETPPSAGSGGHGRLAALAVLCVLAGQGYVYGAGGASAVSKPASSDTVICPNQRYALCATAQCFYLDGVAYCKCDLMQGDSISAPFEFDNGTQDVCDLLDQGLSNGYTVSTFSLPDQVTKEYAATYTPGGGMPPPLALYTCPRGSSTGPYAQCDGGVCFDSTTGKTFPGVGDISDSQILCSCPITDPKKVGPSLGYQISGPWQRANGQACGANDSQADCCSTAYLNQFCNANYSPVIPTGATIPVGAPAGVPVALSIQLGDFQPINACFGR